MPVKTNQSFHILTQLVIRFLKFVSIQVSQIHQLVKRIKLSRIINVSQLEQHLSKSSVILPDLTRRHVRLYIG